MIRGGARKGRAGRRTSAPVGLSRPDGDPVREHMHRGLDAGREALFGHAMGNPGVIESLRAAQRAFADAELAELERLRKDGIAAMTRGRARR